MSRARRPAPPPPPQGTHFASGAHPGRIHPALLAALAATLVLFILHHFKYWFLTDDSFISFRYARNLAHGRGLVFNPGFERVEGYTNFLWVLALGALDALGIAPENAANALSTIFSLGLWALVAWWGVRRWRSEGSGAWALVAPLLLAVTRSVAVWGTSGLETRCFEFLVVAATLRLVLEVESEEHGDGTRRPLAGVIFGLASLARPDGPLLALCAFGAAGLHLRSRGKFRAGAWLKRALPFVMLVAAHLVFRLAYYHEWLPNTYYAKVGGKVWFSSGIRYFASFALEYGALAWPPLLFMGWKLHRERRSTAIPLLFAAVVIPHALYIASIGGDHFEYRPLDLYFPFLYLLMGDGVRRLMQRPRTRVVAWAWLAVVVAGIVALPWRSHAEYPNHYVAGFPGIPADTPEARRYLAADTDPFRAVPGVGALDRFHRELQDSLSANLVGLRQEEHRMFLLGQEPEGRRLGDMVRRGVLPADARVAVDCVGAIPYFSGLRTLDRLGLTDSGVARMPFTTPRHMAHGKRANLAYGRAAGVELWAAHPAHFLWHAADLQFLRMFWSHASEGDSFYVAPVDSGWWLAANLPQGAEQAARRFPRLAFLPRGPQALNAVLRDAEGILENRLSRAPDDFESTRSLAYLYRSTGDFARALPLARTLTLRSPDDPESWAMLAVCQLRTGDGTAASRALGEASDRARAAGRAEDAANYSAQQAALIRSLTPPTAP